MRPYFVPQRRALPGLAANALEAAGRTGPVGLFLSRIPAASSAARASEWFRSLGLTRRRGGGVRRVYASVALGLASAIVALRVLGPTDAGKFTIVVGTVDFLALARLADE